jgi:hypothetical protein
LPILRPTLSASRCLNLTLLRCQSYIIENEFFMNYETNKQKNKLDKIEEEIQMKCYPTKRLANQTYYRYQQIENELRKNKQWPPITPASQPTDLATGLDRNQLASSLGRRSRLRSVSFSFADDAAAADV